MLFVDYEGGGGLRKESRELALSQAYGRVFPYAEQLEYKIKQLKC